MKGLFWCQCSKLDFHSWFQAMWCWNSYPRCVISRGYTMHSDDNRCAIAKDFFNTILELLQSVNDMPTSLLEIIILGHAVGANIDFMVAIFRSSSRVCDGWLLCGCLESVGTSWEWSWDIFWDLAWLPTVFAMVDGWSSLDYFMNISNKLMLLFWTFESTEDVIFIIISVIYDMFIWSKVLISCWL